MIKKRKIAKNYKKFIFIGIFILALSIIFLFTKVYLYVNLLLGNDLIILVDTENENLFLNNGDSEKIEIKVSSITNPFCTPVCSSKFADISKGEVIDEDEFTLKPSSYVSKVFIINAPRKGMGQELYRFDIECKNIDTYLCNTKGEIKTKNFLFTMDYGLNDTEKEIKEESKNKILLLIGNINRISLEFDEANKSFEEINNMTIMDDFKKRIYDFEDRMNYTKENIFYLKELWENEEYQEVSNKIYDAERQYYDTQFEFDYIKYDLISNISSYNNIIENITKIKEKLEGFNGFDVTFTTFSKINGLSKKINDFTASFNKKDYLYNRQSSLYEIYINTEIVSDLIKKDIDEGINLDYTINLSIDEINITKIYFIEIAYTTNAELKEPISTCCFSGKCGKCCQDECSYDKSKFPVILLHGHNFNKKTSAEYSLDTFSSLQKKLEDNDYINAGSLYVVNYDNFTKGILGRATQPMSFKASYYFDILKNKDENIIVQTKTDNIDTYVIRLRDEIKNIKYKTNREKVVIITHSMGGLVVRRYLQIFGSEDIEKAIFIGTPNEGINSRTLKICYLFGTELECRDMDKNSLFMNKITNMNKPDIEVYNIIGTGCEMDNKMGDGIVDEESAYLEWANNYYVNGTCEGSLKLLHNKIIDVEEYPEVYKIIISSLKS